MAMAAQQAAISARQQQQQATLIELEQARVRRALATYAATGTMPPPGAPGAAAGAAATATVGAGGLSATVASGGTAAVGPGASSSSVLYGRAGESTPVPATASGVGSHPSTPQNKKQKIAAGTGGTGGNNDDDEVIVIDGSKSVSTSTHTHKVLQTGLAGPFVRGVLSDDERTLATFRSQSEFSFNKIWSIAVYSAC